MKGSCLCKECVFEIGGRYGAVGKCHCSKCRKVSGTGSNAVMWVRPENLKWLSGEENINIFNLPNENWGSNFCKKCGSPLPRINSEGTTWFVPAGLLDEDPQVKTRGHIWVSSKPSWEVIGDDAPQFDENV